MRRRPRHSNTMNTCECPLHKLLEALWPKTWRESVKRTKETKK